MRLRPDRAHAALAQIDPDRLRAGWPVGLRDGALLALVAAGLSAVEISRLEGKAVHRNKQGTIWIEVVRFDVKWLVVLPTDLAARLLAWLVEGELWKKASPIFTGPRGPLTPIGIINVVNRYRFRKPKKADGANVLRFRKAKK